MRNALILPGLEPAQRAAARAAGLLYLVQMSTAVFGFWAKNLMVVPGDAVQTAANLAASETLFRLAVTADLITCVTVIALVVALYVVLAPVNRGVALLAVSWRLVENAIAAAATLNAFLALRLLSGASYLRQIETEQLQAMARVFIGLHGQGLEIAFVFVGAGSAAFGVLWLRSRYVPRALAVLGIVASLMLSGVTLAIMVFPDLGGLLGLSYMAPMGAFEVTLGVWLLVKGLREPIVE